MKANKQAKLGNDLKTKTKSLSKSAIHHLTASKVFSKISPAPPQVAGIMRHQTPSGIIMLHNYFLDIFGNHVYHTIIA